MPARIRKKAETTNDAGVAVTNGSLPLHIQVRETIRRQVRDGELIDKTGRLLRSIPVRQRALVPA